MITRTCHKNLPSLLWTFFREKTAGITHHFKHEMLSEYMHIWTKMKNWGESNPTTLNKKLSDLVKKLIFGENSKTGKRLLFPTSSKTRAAKKRGEKEHLLIEIDNLTESCF